MKALGRVFVWLLLLAAGLCFLQFGPPEYTRVVTSHLLYRTHVQPLWDQLFAMLGQGGFVVGEASKVEGDVNYRPQSELTFSALREHQRVVARTVVNTGDNASSEIKLIDGSKIFIEPNSSVLIDLPENATDLSSLTLQVLQGTVAAQKADGSAANIKLRDADGKLIDVGQDKASLSAAQKKDKEQEARALAKRQEEEAKQREEEERKRKEEELARKASHPGYWSRMSPAELLRALGEDGVEWLASLFPEERAAVLKARERAFVEMLGSEKAQWFMGLPHDVRAEALAPGGELESGLGVAKMARLRAIALGERAGSAPLLFQVGSQDAARLSKVSDLRRRGLLEKYRASLRKAYGQQDGGRLWWVDFSERRDSLAARSVAISKRIGKADAKRLQAKDFDAQVGEFLTHQQQMEKRLGPSALQTVLGMGFGERVAYLKKRRLPERLARLAAMSVETAHPAARFALDLRQGRVPASVRDKYLNANRGGRAPASIAPRAASLSRNWEAPDEGLLLSKAIYSARLGRKTESRQFMAEALVTDIYSGREGQLNDATSVALNGVMDGYLESKNCRMALETYRNIERYYESDQEGYSDFDSELKDKLRKSGCL